MLHVLRMDSYKLSPVSYSVAVTRGGETKRVSCCVATNVFMLCSQSAYGLSRHTSVMLFSQDAEMSSTLHLQGYNLHRTSAFTKSSLTSLSSAASSSLHFLVAAFFIVSSDAASVSVAAMRRIPAIPGCMTGPNASCALGQCVCRISAHQLMVLASRISMTSHSACFQSKVHASEKEKSAHRQKEADKKRYRNGWILSNAGSSGSVSHMCYGCSLC